MHESGKAWVVLGGSRSRRCVLVQCREGIYPNQTAPWRGVRSAPAPSRLRACSREICLGVITLIANIIGATTHVKVKTTLWFSWFSPLCSPCCSFWWRLPLLLFPVDRIVLLVLSVLSVLSDRSDLSVLFLAPARFSWFSVPSPCVRPL